MTDLAEASRKKWNTPETKEGKYPGDMNMIIGCFQRVAAASEAMAVNHLKLQKDLEFMTGRKNYYEETARYESKRNSNLKGQLTKAKNKIAELEAAEIKRMADV